MQGAPPGAHNPLRVAVIGSGPAGLYASNTAGPGGLTVLPVDLYDRLPTHSGWCAAESRRNQQKIKSLTRITTRIAADPASVYS